MFVHGVNVLVSVGAADEFSANACVFYFLNILLDTTLGSHPLRTSLSAQLTPLIIYRRCYHLRPALCFDLHSQQQTASRRLREWPVRQTAKAHVLGSSSCDIRRRLDGHEVHCFGNANPVPIPGQIWGVASQLDVHSQRRWSPSRIVRMIQMYLISATVPHISP